MLTNKDELLEEFLRYYNKPTSKEYRSAIKVYVLNDYKINSKSINYDNYLSMLEKTSVPTLASKQSNCRQFIFFLYCYGHISDSRFSAHLSENDVKKFKKKMETRKEKLESPKIVFKKDEVDVVTLNFEDLSKLQMFMELETNRKNYKAQFIIYMILWIEFPVDELRNDKIRDRYKDGCLKNTSMGDIEVPYKYREYIEKDKTGFSGIKFLLDNVGVNLSFSKPLTPQILQQSRKKLMTSCLHCEKQYFLFDSRFLYVNNMIVCEKCGEELKKKYYVNELENNKLVSQTKLMLKDYVLFNYLKEEMIKSPIDYLKLHEFQMEIGELGEQYVYEHELKKLQDTDFVDKVDKSKAKDPSNGYDILSYTKNGDELHIEVKTTTTLKDEFYISQPELEMAEKIIKGGGLYKVYFVKDILGNPQLEIIDNIPSEEKYIKKGRSWRMIKR